MPSHSTPQSCIIQFPTPLHLITLSFQRLCQLGKRSLLPPDHSPLHSMELLFSLLSPILLDTRVVRLILFKARPVFLIKLIISKVRLSKPYEKLFLHQSRGAWSDLSVLHHLRYFADSLILIASSIGFLLHFLEFAERYGKSSNSAISDALDINCLLSDRLLMT